MFKYHKQRKGKELAWLDNDKDILQVNCIAELLSAKVRTLKIYEEKSLLPKKVECSKRLYSINDVKLIVFVHCLASAQKINANGKNIFHPYYTIIWMKSIEMNFLIK